MARTVVLQEKNYVGIDNGISGSIGIISACGNHRRFLLTPTFSCQDYTKAKKNITRIDFLNLKNILEHIENPFIVIERPMVNPGRFQATASALRALEATLVIIEQLNISHQFIDSKEWQKVLLPSGIKGSEELKRASKAIGSRLFPEFKSMYKTDADGILIAEWARRQRL